MNHTIKALFIDNAGVLYQTDWAQQFSKMLGREVSAHELHHTWAKLDCIVAYECGQLSHQAFIQAFKQEAKSPLPLEQISECFENILTQPFAASTAVLEKLKPHYQLWLLCNSNDNHWQQHIKTSGYLHLFDGVVASQHIGIMKPNAHFFHQALEQSGVKADEVLFFDDGQRNIKGAEACGITAFLVDSPSMMLNQINHYENQLENNKELSFNE